MKIKALVYVVLIFLIILVQSTILDYIKIFNIKPNLLIVFIISVALLRGDIEGAVIGFFAGLSQDLFSGKFIGLYSLLGLYLGFFNGSVNKRLYRENYLVIIFFTLISTIAYETAVLFTGTFVHNLGAQVHNQIDILNSFKNVILPETIYNCIVSVPIYAIVIKLNESLVKLNKSLNKY